MVSLFVLRLLAIQRITQPSMVAFSLLRRWERQGCTLSSRYRNNAMAKAVANYVRTVDEVFALSSPCVSCEMRPAVQVMPGFADRCRYCHNQIWK
jgi:hypothetical protein